MNFIKRYTHWLHTRWPAGKPEVLPVVADDGTTNVPGLYVVGDLSGVPLLKLSVNAGVRVARRIAGELKGNGDGGGGAGGTCRFARQTSLSGGVDESSARSSSGSAPSDQALDVAIIGGGTAGFAAAKEAEALGLTYLVLEASEPFATIVNFPRGKPIYKYPTDLPLEGGLTFHDKSDVKEGLIDDLREQTVGRGIKWAMGRVSHVKRGRDGFELVLAEAEGVEGQRGKGAKGEGGDANGAGSDHSAPLPLSPSTPLRARRVVVAIGRSGNYRRLGVPGEELSHKVHNRLHDPGDFCGREVLVVGGGDSAMESAIALAVCGAHVTLSYRKAEFNRPKPENIDKLLALAVNPEADATIESASDVRQASSLMDLPSGQPRGTLTLLMSSNVEAIRESEVDIALDNGEVKTVKNDAVFAMIGREAPLEFFRKSGVNILGERDATWWVTLVLFLAFCIWLYHWKKPGAVIAGFPPFSWIAGLGDRWQSRGWFPYNVPAWWGSLGEAFSNPANLLGTLRISIGEPGFYYTVAYCACVVVFGIRRIRRRRTPYVKWQTLTLMVIQCVPLFLLPYVILPWAGNNGAFDAGWLKAVADALFPVVEYGHGREYWRAFGLILAWPLFIFNVFTDQPLWAWLGISLAQTFVIIPAMIYFWGKGAYCGWVCSCGALAETLGDTQRHKMPHGPFWNRLNMVGQVFLFFALALLVLRVAGWVAGPESGASRAFTHGLKKIPFINYAWLVDLLWAGILGVGLYFWFSGRVWCRFACPLAALMHIYARFSRFGILADKKKCISCNVCTSVCHQGIDIMSFANKGQTMIDPQCVRCSACVQSCPTGVLWFGQVDREGKEISSDPSWLAASPVRIAENQVTVNGRKQR